MFYRGIGKGIESKVKVQKEKIGETKDVSECFIVCGRLGDAD